MIAAGDTAALEWAIRNELRQHRVLGHYKLSTARRRQTYAVFVDGEQQGPAGTHREMQQLREDLITRALLALFASVAA